MTRINGKSASVLLVVALFGGVLFTVVSAGIGDGGSKCADASCTPAPLGAQCDPKYGERDECCPVWYCSNGQQSYGITRGSSSGSFSSFSTSSTGGGLPGVPGQSPFGFGSFGGNPFGNPAGGRNNPFGGGNPFGNLFGGFGRR